MPSLFKKQFGFTLIELLVAISILAILATIGLSVYPSVQKSARDARRKDDLRSIKIALELYYQQNNQYPPVADWVYSNANQPWIPNLTTDYIPKVPKDPLQSTSVKQPWNDDQYGYAYWSNPTAAACANKVPAGQFFALVTQLENKTDNQRNQVQNYTWCDGSGLSPSWSNYSFVVTSEY